MNSYFLFASPSFLSGFARVIDLSRSLNEYNYSINVEVADYYAIKSDWNVVGEDLQFAIAGIQKEIDSDGQKETA